MEVRVDRCMQLEVVADVEADTAESRSCSAESNPKLLTYG